MIAHRFAALGLAAAMLHLSGARADVVCAAHGAGDMRSMPAGHGAPGSHKPASQHCTAPSQQDCCEALASCGVVLDASDVLRGVERAVAQQDVIAFAARVPVTSVAAPDPPPPRR